MPISMLFPANGATINASNFEKSCLQRQNMPSTLTHFDNGYISCGRRRGQKWQLCNLTSQKVQSWLLQFNQTFHIPANLSKCLIKTNMHKFTTKIHKCLTNVHHLWHNKRTPNQPTGGALKDFASLNIRLFIIQLECSAYKKWRNTKLFVVGRSRGIYLP